MKANINVEYIFRTGCDLCESYEIELLESKVLEGVNIIRLDVDKNPDLFRHYNDKVPVLRINQQMVNHYFFDRQAIEIALEKPGNR